MKINSFVLALALLVGAAGCQNGADKATMPAREVINNFAGCEYPVKLSLSLDKADGCDRFSYEVKGGKLRIEGSSNVALCRGFYEYVKSQGAGLFSWSGTRFELPSVLEDAAPVEVTSPSKHHFYFNVVTYGYTMPYWDWERWSKELDWMALHGIDMPLALVANEAITTRVFERLGLTYDEIAEYLVGPAHSPWLRMGNISSLDSPVPEEWHEGQVELMHKILDKMRALGMNPICPGFAGFVPKAIKRLYPDLEVSEMTWGGAFHSWLIDPRNELFAEIGKMFIEEWEKEFGKCDYYLVDSFNEMEIPFPPKGDPARYELLADYGEKVFQSVNAANPEATWVMQGWMFGFQRHIWDCETLDALLSKVPDDRMLLLDLAADYNKHFWHSDYNWEFYKGFAGKRWVYSVIPNMGGKVGMTGILDFYANGRLDALNSANRGNLEALGFAPEGIENNEVIYELLSDAFWRSDALDLDKWLEHYSVCRYGAAPQEIIDYWAEIRKGVYGTFTDHPRYVWQFRPALGGRGSINIDEHLFGAIKSFAAAADELGESPLYKIDLEELTAQYLGARMEQRLQDAFGVLKAGGKLTDEPAAFMDMGVALDKVLASHPNLKMDNWIGYARKWGSTPELADYYEKNARRLVTIWGPPVDDYAAKIWSGLVRDYYLPRWNFWFQSLPANSFAPGYAYAGLAGAGGAGGAGAGAGAAGAAGAGAGADGVAGGGAGVAGAAGAGADGVAGAGVAGAGVAGAGSVAGVAGAGSVAGGAGGAGVGSVAGVAGVAGAGSVAGAGGAGAFFATHGQPFDFASWESDWVCNRKGLSPIEPYTDPLASCLDLLKKY